MYISKIIDGKLCKQEVESISFEKNYDVVISGLGTAGSMAAVMAAENGLSVLGIESFNCVGGTTTIGGIQGHYFGCPGGRYAEIDKKVYEFQNKYTQNQIESRKIVVEDMIIAAGAEILYESSICGVYMEDNTVVGVLVITPSGIVDIGLKVLMDCTADAYTAAMAGCAFEYGRESDGLVQPYSMVSLMRAGTQLLTTNFDFGRVDQRDDRQLSEALIFSRAYEMSEERGENEFLIHMPLIGIREGRRIVAEEMVRVEDIFEDKQTDKPAFYSYADLDKHGWDIAFDGEKLGDWAIGANLGAYNITVPVPYKSVIPKGVDGIIVPCRALGVDRDISSCVRMVLDMKKLGEVGADMAALAIRHNCSLRDISYEELSEMLRKSGCLDDTYNRGYYIDGWAGCDGKPFVKEKVNFITEPEKLEERLKTDKPGLAIWSAKRMGEKSVKALKQGLEAENENTRKHAALALAITGDRSGISVLREMVEERDGFMLKDCRKNNQQRGCMAIYFLGRLADTEIVDTLIEIISDKNEILRPVYNRDFIGGTRYKIKDFNNEYFQFVSNAVVALIRIADVHTEIQAKVMKAFKAAFDDGTYYERITKRPEMSSEGNMTLNIKNVAYNAIKKWKLL